MNAHDRAIGARSTCAARARAGGWWREVAVFAVAYLAYQSIRVALRSDSAEAVAHAHWVLDTQARLGLAVEQPIQHALLGTPWLAMLDWVYLAAQSVALVAGIVFVYRTNRRVYHQLRTTLLTTWAFALPIYAAFPTAPPRLAGLGIVDTVSAHTPIGLAAGPSTVFFNPYAAVPSLHAGFAAALAVAVFTTAHRWPLRLAALAWGPLVVLSVLATGNHFVFDVVAGLALTAAGFALTTLRSRAAARRSTTAQRRQRSLARIDPIGLSALHPAPAFARTRTLTEFDATYPRLLGASRARVASQEPRAVALNPTHERDPGVQPQPQPAPPAGDHRSNHRHHSDALGGGQ